MRSAVKKWHKKTRNPLIQRAPGSGADSQIRTGDLILTNFDPSFLIVLYRDESYMVETLTFQQRQDYYTIIVVNRISS